MPSGRVAAVVVGGGLAGAALAARLAGAGREVVLVEREAGPADKVCGEFLSREAGLYLASLGLDLPALGAVPIDTLRLCERGGLVTVPLPFPATSLSRRVLDEALLERAAAAGAVVRRGARVQELSPRGAGWAARLADGSTLEADAAFVATGKHDLRGHKRPAGWQGDLVAFKMHWRLAASQAAQLERHVELVLFEGGYAGLSPVEGGIANLCLLVRQRRLRALGQRWEALLDAMRRDSPHLDARLAGAEPCWPKPLALSSIPYGHVRRASEGLWRLGDQAAVIPSFSGDGMSIALHSAELAAATYLQGGDADRYQRRLARDVQGQVLLATVLSHALVRGQGQAALGAAARRWPGLVSAVAFHTRVSDAALARTALAAETTTASFRRHAEKTGDISGLPGRGGVTTCRAGLHPSSSGRPLSFRREEKLLPLLLSVLSSLCRDAISIVTVDTVVSGRASHGNPRPPGVTTPGHDLAPPVVTLPVVSPLLGLRGGLAQPTLPPCALTRSRRNAPAAGSRSAVGTVKN